MIVEFFMGLWATFVEWLASTIPPVPVPDWLGSAVGSIGQVLGVALQLGYWVPFPVIAVVVPVVLTCMTVGLGIKVVRIVASFLTLGGGAAG